MLARFATHSTRTDENPDSNPYGPTLKTAFAASRCNAAGPVTTFAALNPAPPPYPAPDCASTECERDQPTEHHDPGENGEGGLGGYGGLDRALDQPGNGRLVNASAVDCRLNDASGLPKHFIGGDGCRVTGKQPEILKPIAVPKEDGVKFIGSGLHFTSPTWRKFYPEKPFASSPDCRYKPRMENRAAFFDWRGPLIRA